MITGVLCYELVFLIRVIVIGILIVHKWRMRRCTVSAVSRASLQKINENWLLKYLSFCILSHFGQVQFRET